MSLIPWRNKDHQSDAGSLSPASTFRQEVDRLFDSFLREPTGGSPWGVDRFSPSLDVDDNENEVTVRAEIPGVNPDDIELTVTGDTLVISGEKKESTEKSGQGFRRTERRFGSFRRSVTLPAGIDANKVSADYAQGVLTVRLAKSPQAVSKRIAVKAS